MDAYFSTGPAQLMLVVAALTFMVASNLIGEYAWRVGNISAPFIACLTEVIKLCVSSHFYRKEMNDAKLDAKFGRLLTMKFWWASIYFAIPGGLYFLGNNLALIALKYLSSHLVALLANFKLLVSAGLASIFLKQKFSMLQWISLVLVVVGLVITMDNPGKKENEGEETESEKSDKLMLTIIYSIATAFISAIAGVFCEKLYKAKAGDPTMDNIHLQNVKLYVFGIFFNLIAFILEPNKSFASFGLVHVMVILIGAFQGLAMGFIMKYLDNVVRGIAVAAGSVFNTVLSILMLGNELTAAFVVGGSITLISAHAYRNFPVPKDEPKDDEKKTGDESIEDGGADNTKSRKKAEAPKTSISFYAMLLIPLLLLPILGLLKPLDSMLKGDGNRLG